MDDGQSRDVVGAQIWLKLEWVQLLANADIKGWTDLHLTQVGQSLRCPARTQPEDRAQSLTNWHYTKSCWLPSCGHCQWMCAAHTWWATNGGPRSEKSNRPYWRVFRLPGWRSRAFSRIRPRPCRGSRPIWRRGGRSVCRSPSWPARARSTRSCGPGDRAAERCWSRSPRPGEGRVYTHCGDFCPATMCTQTWGSREPCEEWIERPDVCGSLISGIWQFVHSARLDQTRWCLTEQRRWSPNSDGKCAKCQLSRV